MQVFNKASIEKVLLQLEGEIFLDCRYKFYKVNNELCLLGLGGSSLVYDMYDSQMPDRHYAIKIYGLNDKLVQSNLGDNVSAQCYLGEQSKNIVRVIGFCMIKLLLDEDYNITDIIGRNEKNYEKFDGLELQIICMEKLNNIISKDKFGNVKLLKNDLETEDEVVNFAKQVGSALLITHNNNFLHRDVKLENIFWDEELQQYKLGDFGEAKYVENGNAETVIFTDGYGAPEIEKRLQGSYNATADIYSFGVTLYLLLNDLRFPGSNSYRTNSIQYDKDFVFPAPIHASKDMARIIRKMCSYRARDRYQSIEEVLIEIGKLNRNYTEQGFEEEYEDIETEVYSEDYALEEVVSELKKTEVLWWEKDESELTREERKKRDKAYESMYIKSSIWRVFFFAIFSVFLFKALSPNANYLADWKFWVLPIILFGQAILQSVKEFHIEFGVITICLAVFSMYSLEIDVPQVLILLVVLLGIPAITTGCAIGIELWIAQMLTGKLAWLDFFSKFNLGWLTIVALIVVVGNYILLRISFDRESSRRAAICFGLLNKTWIILIVVGVILLLLEKFNVIIVPEILKHIQLIKTGIGIYILKRVYMYDLDYENEDDTVDEYLDE